LITDRILAELALCQRYFYVVGGVLAIAAGSTDIRMPSVFPVQMRATPTVTANTGTNIFNRFSACTFNTKFF